MVGFIDRTERTYDGDDAMNNTLTLRNNLLRGRGGRRALAFVLTMPLLTAGLALAGTTGDVEPNQAVDLRDLLQIRNALGQTGAPGFIGADVDNNGLINSVDMVLWRQNFPFVGTPLSPFLRVVSPADGSLTGDRRPTIVIDYSPTTLNVDPDSIVLLVDGVDRTADAFTSFRSAVLALDADLGDGLHSVEVTLDDEQGVAAMARSDFEIVSLRLDPKVTPLTGPAPLDVRFIPDVIWADIPPAWYRWDWEDDGVYNVVDARPDARVNTFFEEGVHTVRFQVQQSDGTLTDTTVDIAVTERFASVSPANGRVPLTVFLHGIAADLDDPIVLYEWDFDFDGVFAADYSSTVDSNVTRIYPSAGVFRPVFRATHDSGAMVKYPIIQDELQVTALGEPTASASAAQGAGALTVNFSGTGIDDGSIALYEWDFENDGVWDVSSSISGQASHVYPTAGEKVAAFRVTDNNGNTSIDHVRVETVAPAFLEVLDDTIFPDLDEMVTVRTTTTIESTVWMYVRDADGYIVRTLVDHEIRPAGVYDDAWDGLDFRYEPAHPGAYFVVLQYSYPGRTDTLDASETTGNNHYFAARVPPIVTTLDPLENEPLPMGFRIPSASRTSLYILPGGTNRTNTVFDNLALGAGDYTYFWNGVTSEGGFASKGTYLWSVNGWTLPDNAIVVRSQPELADVMTTPTRLSPTDRPLGSAMAEVSFRVNEPSAVFAEIIAMENLRSLRVIRLSDLPAGSNTLVWDGKAADGTYVSPGFYRIVMIAADDNGNLSIARDAIMEIRY